MSKSILTIDTPISCDNCPLCILSDRYRCIVNKRWCGDEAGYFSSKIKPSWCPLKPYKEAIPVEWLREQLDKYECSTYEGIETVLELWEAENETEID